MAEMDIVPYIGTRTPADFDTLFDELEAARGSSASLSDAIAEKADNATTLSGYGITDAYTKTETGTQITNAIGALDVSSVGGSGKYISAISETDGKISATAETMDTTPTSDSEKAVTSGAVYTALASKQDALSQAQLAAANSGITAAKLTADEAALVELVDGGAKNRLYCDINVMHSANTNGTWSGNTFAHNSGVTFTINSDSSITVNGTASDVNGVFVLSTDFTISQGDWILSGTPTGGSQSTYNTTIAGVISDIGNTARFSSATNKLVRIYVVAGTTVNNLLFKLMVCSADDWAISQKYVPYCPSMQEMYQMILTLQNSTRSAPALSKSEPEEFKEPETGEEEMR